MKNEITVFTRRRKPELKKKISETKITVCRHTMVFNTTVIRWLGVDLDTGLQFMTHKNHMLEKTRRVDDRVQSLTSITDLALELV